MITTLLSNILTSNVTAYKTPNEYTIQSAFSNEPASDIEANPIAKIITYGTIEIIVVTNWIIKYIIKLQPTIFQKLLCKVLKAKPKASK